MAHNLLSLRCPTIVKGDLEKDAFIWENDIN